MTPQAYLNICDGDIDHPVLTHKKMDWSEKYPHWQEIPLVTAQRQWVGLTDADAEEVERWVEFKEEGSGRIPTGKLIRYIEAKLREKNG